MSGEIVKATPAPSGALSLGPMSPHDAWLFAESLARTSLLPDAYRNNASSVLWALEYGRALGLDVVTTITTIHVIKGKPTQSADLMLGRARAAGHRVRIQSGRDRCVVSLTRADDPEYTTEVEWTLADAVTACLCTLTKDGKPYSRDDKNRPQSWEKYPRAMLRARAVAEAVREACPEVLHGAIYTPEELGAYVDQDGNPIDAPVQPLRVVRAQPVEQPVADRPTTLNLEPAVMAQEIADSGPTAVSRDGIRVCWARAAENKLLNLTVTAPDTKELEPLGAYLTRRLQELPEQAPRREGENWPQPGSFEDLKDAAYEAGDTSSPKTLDDEHAAWANALATLEAAAAKAQVRREELEEAFQTQHGTPTEQATIAQLRQMTAVLTRGAA